MYLVIQSFSLAIIQTKKKLYFQNSQVTDLSTNPDL